MSWSTELEIGNPYIDSQHRMLVDLINKLSRVLSAENAGQEQLARVLLEIRKYAEFHFVSEENLMRELHYPGLVDHERLHSQLLSELGMRTVRANQHWRYAREVLSFLIDWLNGHIAHEDCKLTMYAARTRARQLLEERLEPPRRRDRAA